MTVDLHNRNRRGRKILGFVLIFTFFLLQRKQDSAGGLTCTLFLNKATLPNVKSNKKRVVCHYIKVHFECIKKFVKL